MSQIEQLLQQLVATAAKSDSRVVDQTKQLGDVVSIIRQGFSQGLKLDAATLLKLVGVSAAASRFGGGGGGKTGHSTAGRRDDFEVLRPDLEEESMMKKAVIGGHLSRERYNEYRKMVKDMASGDRVAHGMPEVRDLGPKQQEQYKKAWQERQADYLKTIGRPDLQGKMGKVGDTDQVDTSLLTKGTGALGGLLAKYGPALLRGAAAVGIAGNMIFPGGEAKVADDFTSYQNQQNMTNAKGTVGGILADLPMWAAGLGSVWMGRAVHGAEAVGKWLGTNNIGKAVDAVYTKLTGPKPMG